MASWSESIKRAMDRVHTTRAGIIKHLLDRTSPNIIFIWSGKVILGLGFASPNITLPDQINMILVSVLFNKCIIEHGMASLSFQTAVQKNEARLNSFVQFENEMTSYRAL